MEKNISIAKLHRYFMASTGVSTDTRQIQIGQLFFCLKGEKFNGNKFAQKALEMGAAYTVIDEEEYYIDERTLLVTDVLEYLQQLAAFHRRQFNITFLGITGTNGKTTTKELINAVLSKGFVTHATAGNFNNHIGVPLTILSTPKETEIAIIEMGASHQGEIAELCRIAEPDYGIITSIGKAHLEGFGSLEGVIKTKKELYEAVEQKAGKVFVNTDSDVIMKMSDGIDRITYGESDKADIKAKKINKGAFAALVWNGMEIESQLVGGYNFYNMLAAITIGNYFQIENEKIAEALREYAPNNKRSQWMKTENNEIILDAYNANPSSMEVALDSFKSIKTANKWCILGDMLELGEESEKEHKKLIESIEQEQLKKTIFVGAEFMKVAKDVLVFENTDDAREWLLENPIDTSLVLMKGSRGISLEKLLEVL